MAVQLDSILGSHIQRGILSIPHGAAAHFNLSDGFLQRFQLFEGAANNIPDEDSMLATNHIKQMVSSLTKNDVLLMLISGINLISY